MLAPNFHSALH